MKFLLPALFLIMFRQPAFAQVNPYEKVDSIMRAYKEKIKNPDDLYKLVNFIRNNFSEDSIRLRASFIWITENIAYDVKAYKKEDPAAARIYYVLQNKKAICSGYSNLLKYFCDAFKIENRIVEGRARAGLKDLNIAHQNFRINHSWNAVLINNQWRLIDPTWAAGSVDDRDEENLTYIKNYKETYYFTPPERFALNHFPNLTQFMYLSRPVTINQFVRMPLFTTAYLAGSVNKISPDSALLDCRTGDTLTFRFNSMQPIFKVNAWSEREKANYSAAAIFKNDWYEFKYPVKAPGFYNLWIVFNDDQATSVVYKLKVESKQ